MINKDLYLIVFSFFKYSALTLSSKRAVLLGTGASWLSSIRRRAPCRPASWRPSAAEKEEEDRPNVTEAGPRGRREVSSRFPFILTFKLV